jgi:hypothetical protein
MGKSSLMERILQHAAKHESTSISLNFHQADSVIFTDLKLFLKWICQNVARQMQIESKLERYWDDRYGIKDNCTIYFEEYLLPAAKVSLTLALDEFDLIFPHQNIAEDVFGLLRAWHEEGKRKAIWKKFRMIIVHSQEVYIPLNINQSPFNVGLSIELSEFTHEQIQDLASRHDLEWSNVETQKLAGLAGGHPYLVRAALFHLVNKNFSLTELLKIAPTEAGIYSDHLRRHLWNLEQNPKLAEAFKQVIHKTSTRPSSEISFKLDSMGLVLREGNDLKVRCDLYQLYFSDRL